MTRNDDFCSPLVYWGTETVEEREKWASGLTLRTPAGAEECRGGGCGVRAGRRGTQDEEVVVTVLE